MAMEANSLTFRDKQITLVVLLALGIVITLTNSSFTFMDDEIAMLQDALVPMSQTIHSFVDGAGLHRHPPLYDLLLACWMRLTGARVSLLRVPAVAFYLLGLWFVVRAAGLIGGAAASRAALWLGVVFPYGFHFGRIAGWYSLSFCTVAALTCAYLLFAEKPGWKRWLLVIVACELALYTNYFLFAFAGLLLLDYCFTHRRSLSAHPGAVAATVLVVLIASYPILRAFFFRLAVDRAILHPVYSLAATVLFGGYNVYTLFVSESMAPWFWYFSMPVLVVMAFCAYFVLRHTPPAAVKLFLGFLACTLSMTLLNLINTKRLLFLAPWLLIPLAVMLVNLPHSKTRRVATLALALTGAIGWFGIVSRHYYAAPRLIEPWRPVALEAADEVKKDAVVIGNNPSFFFYLTEVLRSSATPARSDFVGTYPVYLKHPRLFDTNQWLQAGKIYGPTTVLVKGAADETFWGSTAATEKVLEQTCRLEGVERELPDSGIALKQRWFADARQPSWRIEVRTYRCPEANVAAALPRALTDPKGRL